MNGYPCPLCKQQHDLKEISEMETTIFKGVEVTYEVKKLYCKNTDDYLIPEVYMDENDRRMKKAYRVKISSSI